MHGRIPTITERYTTGGYSAENPDWHVADSPWKSRQVLDALHGHRPASVCEVGCGAGEILRQLHDRLPGTSFVGFDIAPMAIGMANDRATDRLSFELRDAAEDPRHFEVMLIMDVIEHVPDPIGFLSRLRFKADQLLVHIPLDLSVQSVLRPQKLLWHRDTVGHIHYFTPETALATVRDAGWDVQGHAFTRTFDTGAPTWKSRMARLPRRALPPMWTVRLLGGYSILIAARPGAGKLA